MGTILCSQAGGHLQIGATFLQNQSCEFVVWAPFAKQVKLHLISPQRRTVCLEKIESGYWQTAQKVLPQTHYYYSIDGRDKRPDPASHFQPKGVHGPSQVIDHGSFAWQDQAWSGIPLAEMIIYELHVGTFTPQGTFAAIIPRLPVLKDLGINTIEIMPIAAFPGKRNWGYDGVQPFAVQNSYGGPERFKALVNACHQQGIAVMLDVVYNHFGPEGNYFHEFGPYFTKKYKTPWGAAINFDDMYSDEVRNYFIQNALHWFGNYHVDALRLDAIQAIFDQSAYPFLAELADKIKAFSRKCGRPHLLIAESDLNDVRVSQPVIQGGYGLDASWCDDLHHSLHAICTGERQGYYKDFGSFAMLFKALRDGYAFRGQYSKFRKRCYGSARQELPGKNLVVFGQNHDQVGNRPLGERLSQLADFAALKWVAGIVLLSPYIPLLFMGEEYGEETPFFYFVDHSEPKLNAVVRRGREQEFRAFQWKETGFDPASPEVFAKSRLHWENRNQGRHKLLWQYYKSLIKLRKEIRDTLESKQPNVIVNGFAAEKVLTLHWEIPARQWCCMFHCCDHAGQWRVMIPAGVWKKQLDSADFSGDGVGTKLPPTISEQTVLQFQAYHVVVYVKEY